MTARIPDIGNIGLRWPGETSTPGMAQAWRTVGFVCADLGAILMCLAVTAAVTGRLAQGLEQWSWHGPIAVTTVMLGAVVLYFGQQGHYSRRLPFWSMLGHLLAGSSAGLLASCFVLLAFRGDDLSLPLVAWIMFPIIALSLRRCMRGVLSATGLWELRAVVVGMPEAARQAAGALLSESSLGYNVVATVAPASLSGIRSAGVWRNLLKLHGAELLVVAPQLGDGLDGAAEALVRDRVPFAIMPQPDGLPVHGLARTNFFSHDTVLFSYKNNLVQPLFRALKVAFDLSVAVVLLIILSPVLATVALLVALDGGPILYRHMRLGVGGKAFPCLKFRSMVPNGDSVLRETLAADPVAAAEWRETRKLKKDPRVTWIGKHLRSTSLDELPQLLNVLRLEMSLVGPRPIVEAEVPRYGDNIAYYFETRPGLTGLWQVSGRSDTGYAQRVSLDTWYVKNWSMWHDMAILAKTVPAVLARKGAV